jgi:Protein of unknown function (DUF2865)
LIKGLERPAAIRLTRAGVTLTSRACEIPMIDIALRNRRSRWWARSAAARTNRRAYAIGALGLVLGVIALAGALAETSGCARCGGGGPPSPATEFATPVVGGFRPIIRESAPTRRRAHLSLKLPGGSYMVCVRTCDGSFFPATYFGAGSRADSLEEVCQMQCPNAKVELYSFPFGGTIDEAVSSTGQAYALLPNGHKFEQAYDPGCSCRHPDESWAAALAQAEARYGHGHHDILVTEEISARMSRPVGDPKTKSPQPGRAIAVMPMRVEGADPSQSDIVTDINGVDTKLRAAAASMSRETAGIKDETVQGGQVYGLNQGRTVEENGPDGSPRRVRIVAPMF